MAASSKTKKFLSTTAIAAASLMAMTGIAKADDHAWVLDNAGGTFSTDLSIPATTTITQTSDRAIGVGNLDIAAHQSVNIVQNNSGSLFVAKDNRNDPTVILGKLKANGGVMILDENGIMFGAGSIIDTGSLVASTGGVSDAAIMRGDNVVDLTNFGDAGIVNDGNISVGEGGLAALVAPQVVNNGTITAKVGKVVLASGGERATVDLYGDGLIELTVNENGQSKAMIENAGKIEGAKVVMTAAAAKDVVDTVINVSGVVNASSASVQGGKIVLNGGKNGVVKVSGKLDASGENGGTIKVTGRNILVDSLAELLADGGNNGNGGDIRVIGENAAIVQGRFSARGGSQSGNGGFVEVSGLNYLNFAIGNVDTTAANGQTGMLFIDPLNVEIRGGVGDSTDNGGVGVPGQTNLDNGTIGFDENFDGSNPFVIYESEIEGQSASTNITIEARRNITTAYGTSTDGYVTLANNRNLTIQTRNNAGGAEDNGVIDLSNLGFATQGTGSMTITASTGTGRGDIILGNLSAQAGNITASTDNGSITVGGAGANGGNGGPGVAGGPGGPATESYWINSGGTKVYTDPATGWTQYNWQKGSGNSKQYATVLPGNNNGWTALNPPLWYNGTSYTTTNPSAGWTPVSGSNGANGADGADGANGTAGPVRGNALVSTTTGSINLTASTAINLGGIGGNGGNGGNGGAGGAGGNGTANQFGGNGGAGGDGGNGANAGNGGNGTLSSVSGNINLISDDINFKGNTGVAGINGANGAPGANGTGSKGGVGGIGGIAGTGGAAGLGGSGSITTGGAVTIDRYTAGTIGLGGASGNLMLSDSDLASITARDLFIGSPTELNNKVTAIYVDTVNTTANISRRVTLSNYLNQTNGISAGLQLLGAGAVDNNNVMFAGVNTFNALTVNANDHIVTYGTPTTTINTVTGDMVLNADANAQGVGALLMSYNSGITTNGHNFTYNGHEVVIGDNATINAQGGNILLNNDHVFYSFDADSLITSGTGTITLNQWAKTFADPSGAFGPRVGSINNAGNAVYNTGTGQNTVNVGAGTFDETVQLSGQNNLWIKGAGQGLTIVKPTSLGAAPALSNGTPWTGQNYTPLFLAKDASNVDVTGLSIDGTAVDSGTTAGLTYYNASGDAENVTILNGGAFGFYAVADSTKGHTARTVNATNVTSSGNSWAALAVIGNVLTANVTGGVYNGTGGSEAIDLSNGSKGSITNATITTGSNSENAGIVFHGGHDWIITGGSITGSNAASTGIVDLGTAYGVPAAANVAINGVNISNVNTGVSANGGSNWDINGGKYTGAAGATGAGVRFANLTGSNSTVKNLTVSSFNEGIVVDSSAGTQITGNLIKTIVSNAVSVINSASVHILNNVIGYTTLAATTEAGSSNIGGDGIKVNNGGSVVIKGNKIAQTNGAGAIEVINTNTATIGGAGSGEGNRIRNSNGGDGVRMENDSNVTVENNNINGTNRVGIWGGNVSTAIIKNNIVQNDQLAGYGSIHADGGSNWTVSGNDIDFGDYGIRLNTVTGTNTINGTNKVDNVTADAIYVVNTTGLSVASNRIGMNGGNIGGDGIEIQSSHGAVITNNRVNDTDANGIFVNASNDVKVGGAGEDLGNDITKAGMNGILVSGGEDALVQHNTVYGTNGGFLSNGVAGAQQDGIRVDGNDGVDILNNTIAAGNVGFFSLGGTGAVGHGISVYGSNGAVIARNQINPNLLVRSVGGDGIHVEDSHGLTIGGLLPVLDANFITGTGGDGIFVDGSMGAFVLNNVISLTGDDGIDMNKTLGTLVAGNIITATDGDGIEFPYGALSGIGLNVITKAGDNGINISDSKLIAVGLNNIHDTDNHGIALSNSKFALVGWNDISDADEDGINVRNSRHISIVRNDIDDIDHDGINVSGGNDILIKKNKVTNVDNDGIYAGNVNGWNWGQPNVRIEGNIVDWTGQNGIVVANVYDSLITGNFVGLDGAEDDFSIGANGILVTNETDDDPTVISNNQVANTAWDGIRVAGVPVVKVTGNTVWNNGDDGIDVSNGDEVRILGNTVTNTGDDGIVVTNVGNFYGLPRLLLEEGDSEGESEPYYALIISDNTVTDAGQMYAPVEEDGEGEEGPSEEFTVLRISELGGDGIDVYNASTALISENTVDNAYDDGIVVASDAGQYLEGKNARSEYRPVFFGSSSVVILDNDVTDSGTDGIEVNGISTATVDLNRVINSGVNGFLAGGAFNGDVILTSNIFTDNPTGARFESGLIDLTGEANTFKGGVVGLQFDPAKIFGLTGFEEIFVPYGEGEGGYFMSYPIFGETSADLNLVDNTIGTTVFDDTSKYYVELLNGALFNPGTPTIINGLNATYDDFKPSDVGGILSPEQYTALESKIWHYNDDPEVGLFFFGVQQDSISDEDAYNTYSGFAGPGSQFRITILGLPRLPGAGGGGGGGAGGFTGNIADFLANIAPAAGGPDGGKKKPQSISVAEQLADLEPAAGGAGDEQDAACWSQAIAAASAGAPVNYSFGASMEESLNQAAACGSGTGI